MGFFSVGIVRICGRNHRWGGLTQRMGALNQNEGDGYPRRWGRLPVATGKFARLCWANLPEALKKSWASKLLIISVWFDGRS